MATTAAFFEQPILNSPYEYPFRHWELDPSGQPTNRILPERRKVAFITPIPKPKKQKGVQQERSSSTRPRRRSGPRRSNTTSRRSSAASATMLTAGESCRIRTLGA